MCLAANADYIACALLRPVIEPSIFPPLESLTLTIPSHRTLLRNVTCKAYTSGLSYQVFAVGSRLLSSDHQENRTNYYRTMVVNIILMVILFSIDLYPMKNYQYVTLTWLYQIVQFLMSVYIEPWPVYYSKGDVLMNYFDSDMSNSTNTSVHFDEKSGTLYLRLRARSQTICGAGELSYRSPCQSRADDNSLTCAITSGKSHWWGNCNNNIVLARFYCASHVY